MQAFIDALVQAGGVVESYGYYSLVCTSYWAVLMYQDGEVIIYTKKEYKILHFRV